MKRERGATRKRLMVVGGILLGVALTGAATAEAWAHGRWFGRGAGCMGFFHHGPGAGKNMQDFVLSRLDEKAAKLNMTADQKEKYDELRASIKAHLTEATADHAAMRESFRTELAKENPDVASLTEKAKVRIQDVSGVMQKHLDLFTAFYESLDGNQKKLLLTEVRKRMTEHAPYEAPATP